MERKILFVKAAAWLYILSVIYSCNKPGTTPNNNTSTNTNTIIDDRVNYTVSTFVGNGMNGIDPLTGGPGQLYYPSDIAFDLQGNLYIADVYNNRIRKVTPNGIMTNFAGNTNGGYADGTGTAAQFSRPAAMTIDNQGNLFVGESQGLHIRKITPNGVVTTIAGNGTAGLVDGIGTAAQINIPAGIATDPQGNIYFTQIGFNGVRKISPSGTVSTFVGSGTPGFVDGNGTVARFNEPFGIVSDASGNLYISDYKNICIRKVTPAGVVSTILKKTNENEIRRNTYDTQGNFYVVQGDLSVVEIVKISSSGNITKIAGGPAGYQDGGGNIAKFGTISGISIGTDGNLYVTDLSSFTVRKIKKN